MVGFIPGEVELPQLTYGVAGALSGLFTRALSQPLDVLKIRLQLQEQPIRRNASSKYYGILHATQTIWKEEGITAFWKGHCAAQVLSVVFGLVQFATFETLTREVWQWLPSYLTTDIRPVTHFVCGGFAGCSATLAAYPFDVIRTRFVAQSEPKVYKSMLGATRQIVANETVFGLYRGLVPTLIQIAPQTGFQFGFYSGFSSLWLVVNRRRGKMQEEGVGSLGGLVCGSAAGVCAKVAVYPLDVIKKRLQIQGFVYERGVGATTRTYTGFVNCMRQVVSHEGVGALYKGLSPSLLKALVATGLHFSSYEYCLSIVRRIFRNIQRT